MFHLTEGFYFGRDGDDVVLAVSNTTLGERPFHREVRVPANEWASAVAATSARGETGETFAEALELLTREA